MDTKCANDNCAALKRQTNDQAIACTKAQASKEDIGASQCKFKHRAIINLEMRSLICEQGSKLCLGPPCSLCNTHRSFFACAEEWLSGCEKVSWLCALQLYEKPMIFIWAVYYSNTLSVCDLIHVSLGESRKFELFAQVDPGRLAPSSTHMLHFASLFQ